MQPLVGKGDSMQLFSQAEMKTGIIGAGKVGTSIAKYLKINNYNITGFYSRNIQSAKESAQFAETNFYTNPAELISASDIIFITVQDDNIKTVWNEIKENVSGKIVCHFSGVHSSEIFEEYEKYNAKCCSIHPMAAFSDKFNSYKNLGTVNFVMEGNQEAVSVMKNIFHETGNNVHIIDTANKAKYHAAAALASNHMIALFKQSMDLLAECSFDSDSAAEILTPLVKGNIESLLAKGCEDALTGPVIRNDVNTVMLHLDALDRSKTDSEPEKQNVNETDAATEAQSCDTSCNENKQNYAYKETLHDTGLTNEIYDTYVSTAITLLNIAQYKNPQINYDKLRELIVKKI